MKTTVIEYIDKAAVLLPPACSNRYKTTGAPDPKTDAFPLPLNSLKSYVSSTGIGVSLCLFRGELLCQSGQSTPIGSMAA